MAERRALELRPQAAAVGGNDNQPAAVSQHPPDLPHQRLGVLGALQCVHQQDTVETAIGERQRRLFGEQGQIGGVAGPVQDPLRRWHQRRHPQRLGAEDAEEGGSVAQAENIRAAHIRPQRADAPPNHPPGNPAQPGRVKIAQIDGVRPHDRAI